MPPRGDAKPIECEADPSFVAQLPKPRQALLGQCLSPQIVALHEGEARGGEQRLGSYRWRHLPIVSQRPLQVCQPFVAVASYYPESLQGRSQAQCPVRLLRFLKPVQRRTQ